MHDFPHAPQLKLSRMRSVPHLYGAMPMSPARQDAKPGGHSVPMHCRPDAAWLAPSGVVQIGGVSSSQKPALQSLPMRTLFFVVHEAVMRNAATGIVPKRYLFIATLFPEQHSYGRSGA